MIWTIHLQRSVTPIHNHTHFGWFAFYIIAHNEGNLTSSLEYYNAIIHDTNQNHDKNKRTSHSVIYFTCCSAPNMLWLNVCLVLVLYHIVPYLCAPMVCVYYSFNQLHSCLYYQMFGVWTRIKITDINITMLAETPANIGFV